MKYFTIYAKTIERYYTHMTFVETTHISEMRMLTRIKCIVKTRSRICHGFLKYAHDLSAGVLPYFDNRALMVIECGLRTCVGDWTANEIKWLINFDYIHYVCIYTNTQ